MLRWLPTKRSDYVRFINFLVVGGVSAVVQFVALWLLKNKGPSDLVFTVAYVLSVATHYALLRLWALPSSRQDSVQQFGEYLGTVAISYAINIAAFKFCHDVMGLGIMWAAVWAVPPSTVIIFLLLNYRVFREKRG